MPYIVLEDHRELSLSLLSTSLLVCLFPQLKRRFPKQTCCYRFFLCVRKKDKLLVDLRLAAHEMSHLLSGKIPISHLSVYKAERGRVRRRQM